MRVRTLLAAGAAAAAAPSLVSFGPARRRLTPALVDGRVSGLSDRRHVALTFDDGPDRDSTPHFLQLLDSLDVRATFFVLGRHLADHGLVRELHDAGHELGVHGWDHRPVALHAPTVLRDGLRRTRELVEDATGQEVRWYRPPYGLVTSTSCWAARSAGLETVLWSAWGRDWERGATPVTIARRVNSQLVPGGTVLLHDSDCTSAAGSWRRTLPATAHLVQVWRAEGLAVGPLREHWD